MIFASYISGSNPKYKTRKEEAMQDTAIASSMEAAGKCARYDAAAKRILSFKAVIAWILKKSVQRVQGL